MRHNQLNGRAGMWSNGHWSNAQISLQSLCILGENKGNDMTPRVIYFWGLNFKNERSNGIPFKSIDSSLLRNLVIEKIFLPIIFHDKVVR